MSAPFPGPRGLAHARVMGAAGDDVRLALDLARSAHGDSFVFGFGSIRFHWFLGLSGAHLILRDAPESFGNAGAYPFLTPVGGKTALIATDDPEHLRRRRVVQPAFHKARLATWSALAADRFDALVAELLAHGPQPLHPRLRPAVLEVVLDILLGPGVRDRRPGLLTDVMAMMDYANLPMITQWLKLPLPGTRWQRFRAARWRADRAIRAEIRARQTGEIADDVGVMALLLRAKEPLTEDEMRDQALSLVSAGFDTSSAAISWLSLLLADPDAAETAAAELAAIPSPVEASEAPFTTALMQEALRLYPPAPAILRRVRVASEWQGYALPKGAGVALSLWHLHRDERLWHDPQRVEVRRWTERDGPWAAPADPFAFIPFGHGGRYCIGAGLARSLTLAFAWTATRRARWSLVGSPPRPVGVTLLPDDGLVLRWQSRPRAQPGKR